MQTITLNYGEMPSEADFTQRARECGWHEGNPFRLALRGNDKLVGVDCLLANSLANPSDAYQGILRLVAYAAEVTDEDLAEAARGLASGLMQSFGYDWI